MNQQAAAAAGENPFCARRIRPGAMPFLFAPGQSAAQLVAHLQANRWRGQVIGPHGSGKSALLAALIPAIEAAGRRVVLVELHDGQSRLPRAFRRSDFASTTIIVVDGYEQLGRLSRCWLARFCGRRGLGLLVTAHDPVGLPLLFRSEASISLAERVIGQLLGERARWVSDEEVAARFARHGGDMRELLFDLYDLYEQRQRGFV